MKFILSQDHKAHIRAIGVPVPPNVVEADDQEYSRHLAAWKCTHPQASDEELHKHVLANLVWAEHTKKQNQPKSQPEPEASPAPERKRKRVTAIWLWRIAVLAILLGILCKPAHAQFSHINTITLQNSDNSQAAFFASPFTLKVGSNCSWAVTASTATFNCTGGAASAGGSNTQVQYNNAAALGGITNMTSDGTNVTKLTAGAGAFDLRNATITQLRVGSGLTTAATGDIGQNSTDGAWHFFFNGNDRLIAAATNKGSSGQLLQSNGDGTYTNADPIVSLNYVNLWTAQDVTTTRTSSTVRVSNFGASGTLFLTWASITGSPSSCTLQLKSADSAGNLVNNGSTVSVTPSNGTTSQVVQGASTVPTQAQMAAIFACSAYPSTGTLTLDFVPSIVNFTPQLPAALDGSGFLKTHEQGTAAISAVSLPLPTGAAQDSSLTTLDTDLKANVVLAAGTHVIGHVIADTGSTTAVTGNVAVTKADGSDVTLGAKADAKSTATDTTAITVMQVLKEISAMEQAPASRAVTNAGTFAAQSTEADGANTTLGAKADAKSTATDITAVTVMQVLKEISAMEQAPASRAVTNTGTFAVQEATLDGAISSSKLATKSADGDFVTLGTKTDAAATQTDTTAVSAISILKELSAKAQAPASTPVTNAGTFAVQAQPTPVTSGGLTTCVLQSAASTNATNCKNAAGQIYHIEVINTTSTLFYLRLYNLGSAPTCSSATGFVRSIPVPHNSGNGAGFEAGYEMGEVYGTGIGFCFTGGGSSTDNTNAATGVYITIFYK